MLGKWELVIESVTKRSSTNVKVRTMKIILINTGPENFPFRITVLFSFLKFQTLIFCCFSSSLRWDISWQMPKTPISKLLLWRTWLICVGFWSPYCCHLHTHKGGTCLPFLGMNEYSFSQNIRNKLIWFDFQLQYYHSFKCSVDVEIVSCHSWMWRSNQPQPETAI